jgi:biopolymer transport protein ExbD
VIEKSHIEAIGIPRKIEMRKRAEIEMKERRRIKRGIKRKKRIETETERETEKKIEDVITIKKGDHGLQIVLVADREVLIDEEMKARTDIREEELREVVLLHQREEDEDHHQDGEALVGRKDVVARLLLGKAKRVMGKKQIKESQAPPKMLLHHQPQSQSL